MSGEPEFISRAAAHEIVRVALAKELRGVTITTNLDQNLASPLTVVVTWSRSYRVAVRGNVGEPIDTEAKALRFAAHAVNEARAWYRRRTAGKIVPIGPDA